MKLPEERSTILDKRNAKRLVSEKNGVKYELAMITLIGIAYIFVKDRAMNTLEKGKGKKFAYLHYDLAQKVAVERRCNRGSF